MKAVSVASIMIIVFISSTVLLWWHIQGRCCTTRLSPVRVCFLLPMCSADADLVGGSLKSGWKVMMATIIGSFFVHRWYAMTIVAFCHRQHEGVCAWVDMQLLIYIYVCYVSLCLLRCLSWFCFDSTAVWQPMNFTDQFNLLLNWLNIRCYAIRRTFQTTAPGLCSDKLRSDIVDRYH